VDVSPNGGVVKVNQEAPLSYPSVHTFGSDAKVFLEAVPSFGYRFKNWDGDLSGTTSYTIILIDCDKSIIANFSVNWPFVGGIVGPLALVGFLVFVLGTRR